ncbi:MAG TPA: zf-HC2 domain-containing protein [Candidatus Obscuribacterales bacterium]
MSVRESDCTKIEPLLDAFRDGELASAERQAVEQHLRACFTCQSKLADIERVVSTLKTLPRVGAPRDFSQNIDAILARRHPAKVMSIRPVVWGSLGAAAAAAVAVFVFKLVPGISPAGVVAHRSVPGTRAASPYEKPDSAQQREIAAQGPQPGVTTPPQQPEDSDSRSLLASGTQEKQPDKLATAPPGEQQAATGGKAGAADRPAAQQRTVPVYSGAVVAVDEDPLGGEGAALVAFAEGDQTTITEAIGLETDEDGLYAIKM